METTLQPYVGTDHPDLQAPIGIDPGAGGRDLLRVVVRWVERRRQRRALARLDAHLLADIGVTPGEAAREFAKPFWR